MSLNRMTLLAQDDLAVRDNGWLDQFELHFGEWFKQIIDWSDQNLRWFLDALIWPFRFLFDLLMNEDEGAASIMSIPWYWVAIVFFLIGATTRTTRVGLMAALMVVGCGLLGPDYWSETTKTFGMIFVSVLICAIIGIPLGVLCGRVDSVWRGVRPVLDAMQVVHPFVYILPFFFFWGPGEPSATMATMVFALPPLVRLTNLGVRQVPADVVEASRAFGSSERRVLTEVQLPLARPAIMTGLNQTLLMSISMLGIAAIMGAGGLGKLLLQAINSQNLPQATSGGLAYFFVAVALDRITQRESADGVGLFGRIRESWNFRKDPEGLLAARSEQQNAREAVSDVVAEASAERDTPVSAAERLGLVAVIAGSALVVVATLLAWGSDSGLISGWGRAADVNGLVGQSFSGLEASGGTIFGVVALGAALVAALCAVRPMLPRFGPEPIRLLNKIQGIGIALMALIGVVIWVLHVAGQGFNPLPNVALAIFAVVALAIAAESFVASTPRMGADGALICALGALGSTLGYFLARPTPGTEAYSHSIGVWVALVGGAVAVLGGLLALFNAPYVSRVPIKLNVKWSLVVTVLIALVALIPSMVAPWVVDERLASISGSDGGAAVIPPEIQAEIDRLREEAGNDINKQIAAGQEITNLINTLQNQEPIVYSGFDDEGPGLGWPTLIIAGLATVAAMAAAGLVGGAERFRWRAGTIATGLGFAAMAIPFGWIFAFVRSGEPRALTGNGSFFAMMICYAFVAVGMTVIGDFRRRKIFGSVTVDADPIEITEPASADEAEAAVEVVAGTVG